jgi:hypothetical protein
LIITTTLHIVNHSTAHRRKRGKVRLESFREVSRLQNFQLSSHPRTSSTLRVLETLKP